MQSGLVPGRAIWLKSAAIVACAVSVGCGSAMPLPVGPSVDRSTPPAPTAPTTIASVATLGIEDAFAIGFQGHDSHIYEVRFLLREVGGRSGAVIKWVTVSNPNLRSGEHTSKQHQSESCWRDELRVPAGGTLDTFYTDAGARWLSYCWVGIDALPGVSSLEAEVFYKDDYGYEGSVRATITTFR